MQNSRQRANEKLVKIYRHWAAKGLSPTEMADRRGVGTSTVVRSLRHHNIDYLHKKCAKDEEIQALRKADVELHEAAVAVGFTPHGVERAAKRLNLRPFRKVNKIRQQSEEYRAAFIADYRAGCSFDDIADMRAIKPASARDFYYRLREEGEL